MCEINFMYAIDENYEFGNKDLDQIISMLQNSSSTNADGFGAFNEKGIILKEPLKFDKTIYAKNFKSLFKDSRFIVSHCRLATHGNQTIENTHPFAVNSFIFVHNGVITNENYIREKYNIKDKSECDSVVIGHLLHYYNKKYNNLTKAIKALCKEITGWYSVFVYDIKTKELIYFRHNASFTFALVQKENNHYILGATNANNLVGFQISKAKTLSTFEPTENTIYKITSAGIKKVAEFSPRETYYAPSYEPYKPQYTSNQLNTSEAIEIIEGYYPNIKIKRLSDTRAIVKNNEQFIKDFKGYFISIYKGKATIKCKTIRKIAKKLDSNHQTTMQYSPFIEIHNKKFPKAWNEWKDGCYECY